jgi:hypothetical protein
VHQDILGLTARSDLAAESEALSPRFLRGGTVVFIGVLYGQYIPIACEVESETGRLGKNLQCKQPMEIKQRDMAG